LTRSLNKRGSRGGAWCTDNNLQTRCVAHSLQNPNAHSDAAKCTRGWWPRQGLSGPHFEPLIGALSYTQIYT
jgi:hypothetical protein